MKAFNRVVLGAFTFIPLGVIDVDAQTHYTTDGEPTALEEEIRWVLNRGRFDSAAENASRGTSYSDIQASSPPVAPHHSITVAARRHSEDMAKNNAFQHGTIQGSAFYNPDTQPTPWDRMEAEGYDWNGASENIAAGYRSAKSCYIGWWNSTGHRRGMYGEGMREIGNGYFYWRSSTYGHYYTMDLGRSGSNHFFTGTLFHDVNGDNEYNQGEGVAGLQISLATSTLSHTDFDISATAGNFAIPIRSIPDGSTVEVTIVNPTESNATLTIPLNYHDTINVTIGSGQALAFGTFEQPGSVRNIGWRDVAPRPQRIGSSTPGLAINQYPGFITVEWESDLNIGYKLQGTSDFLGWTDIHTEFQAGTGSTMSITLLTTGRAGHRYSYRCRYHCVR